jgi:Tol biopolymer transport system component
VSRRKLLPLVAAAVLVVVAGVVAYLLVRDDDERTFPGRVAVVDGCGLMHMWQDGTDQRRMCLDRVWAAVSVSRDGESLAWDTSFSGQSGILVGDENGETAVNVPVLPGANFEPSLSPDGERIAFLHSARDDGRYNLWVGSTTRADHEQLTDSRNVSTVVWSPKGDRLAYVRGWSADTLEGDIVVTNEDGEGERVVARGESPSWAPDGERLVFARGGNLWTVDVDGSRPQGLLRNGHEPSWSRDGEQIAFMRETDCTGEGQCKERAFVVPAGGGQARAIGPTFTGPRRLVWLPDPFE